MTTDAGALRRRRVVQGALAVLTVGAGLLVHARIGGVFGDIAGDALYAVLVSLLVAVALPRAPLPAVALIAIAACSAVELLQLTGIPGAISTVVPAASLVLGSGFDPRDLVVYAAAAIAASVIDAVALRVASRRGTPEGALPKESAL